MKGQKHGNDEELDKVLNQDCPHHPGKGHTLGECRILADALKTTANKKPRPAPKGKGKNTNQGDDVNEDGPQDPNLWHVYREPKKNVTAVIFGGKIGLKNV